MQESGFPKMCHYVGVLQIRSQIADRMVSHRYRPLKSYLGHQLDFIEDLEVSVKYVSS